MRFYVRLSRYSGVSVGPGMLLLLLPLIALGGLVYLTALAIYGLGWAVVIAVEDAADWAERRQRSRG